MKYRFEDCPICTVWAIRCEIDDVCPLCGTKGPKEEIDRIAREFLADYLLLRAIEEELDRRIDYEQFGTLPKYEGGIQ